MTRPIRILHVISGDLWAGAEAQAYTLIGWLRRHPDAVVGAVVLNAGTLTDKLRALGIPVKVYDETQLNAVRILRRLTDRIQEWRPDLIHTHREKENILAAIANRLARRVPLVRTVHGGEEPRRRQRWLAVRRRLVTGVDRLVRRFSAETLIAVSAELAANLPERARGRVAVIENGVDCEEVRARILGTDASPRTSGAVHIGIVGRLVPVKRVDLFLETAARLIATEPAWPWRFEVFGDGPERARLEALRNRLGLIGYATFHGHRADIARGIGGLDVLVMCSDHEGMPMAALEAAALGVPTVGHAVGGLVDLLPTEFQVERHDPVGYGDAILRALRDDVREAAAARLGVTLERFSAARNGERTLALYRRLIDASGGSTEHRLE